jgi:hypothetical protein
METADMMRVNVGPGMWAIQTMSEAQADQIGRGVVHDPSWKRKNRHPIDHGAGVNVRDIVDRSLGNLINDHARKLALLVEELYDTDIRLRSTYIQKWDHKHGETVHVPGGQKGWISVTPLENAIAPSGGLHFPEFGITYEGIKGRTLFFPNWYERTALPVTMSFTTIRTRHA